MKEMIMLLALAALVASSADAATTVSGVGAITESVGSIDPPVPGETNLVNTGTILDGVYGTENQAYLVDDYPGGLGWGDNLKIQATMVVNDDGTVNGADQIAILGYFADANHGDGDYQGDVVGTRMRGDAMFGVSVLGPGGGGERIFLSIGGNLVGPVANWNSDFGGRNNPFDVDLTASEAGGTLTVTGTMSNANGTVNINSSSGVNSIQVLEAFGVMQGFDGHFNDARLVWP